MAAPAGCELELSAGEIHFLWHFIQGSIMIPETRASLRRAWGLCARHSFGWIAAEAAFRHGYLHGPAIVYEELMERACAAFASHGPLGAVRIAGRLREGGLCLVCGLGLTRTADRYAPPDVVGQGRDLSQIRAFAGATEQFWRAAVCGRCAGSGSTPRCRVHLREDLLHGGAGAELPAQRVLVEAITGHLRRYARAFRWDHRGTDTPEDRAALVSASGWYSGWAPWLVLCGRGQHGP